MADIFRKEYRPLTDEEKDALMWVKTGAATMLETLQQSVNPYRELSLAITKLEECVFWAVKGITG